MDGRKQPSFVLMPQKAFGYRSNIMILNLQKISDAVLIVECKSDYNKKNREMGELWAMC